MARSLPVLQSSLNKDGSRNYVHPADVKGRFTRSRNVVFAVLMVVYLALPFVEVGGRPAVFLDVAARRFYLFGASFNAQDFWLVFFLLTGVALVLFVITTLWGRVWCGYACPQTVFLEGVYRRIERLIEGPRNLRLRRNAASWTFGKAWRKTLKHALFVVLSLFFAHFFVSYFVSLPSLLAMMQGSPAEHPYAFGWMAAMTLVLYFNFAWFREQLCLIICPYGRLQSTLTDRDTMVIGYDEGRGEPRGKARDPNAGDCVSCSRCVVVCPTGIDIRNGLQMECIGCAACIDACDEVMTKLKRPTGLIRYDSMNGFEGKKKRVGRRRLLIYSVALLAWGVGAIVALTGRGSFEANLLRSGSPFVTEGEVVRNALQVHLVNKSDAAQTFVLRGGPAPLEYVLPMPEVTLAAGEGRHVPVLVQTRDFEPGLRAAVEVRLQGVDEGRRLEAAFLGPGR
ncbi:MAG: cytochrome c oxidase accessory protein CcoG [Myxococcota bacterium]